MGGAGLADPEGVGASRLFSRASTGPVRFGGWAAGGDMSLAGGVALALTLSVFTLNPDPGSLRAGAEEEGVGVEL